MAFSRWNVEHTFRVAKSELGLSHFEGRNYVALIRHHILCLIVMGFIAEQTDRLRGEKSGDHVGASLPGLEPALRDVVPEPTRNDGPGSRRRSHRLPSAPQSRRKNLTTEAETTR